MNCTSQHHYVIRLYRLLYRIVAALVERSGPAEKMLRRWGNHIDGLVQWRFLAPSRIPNPLTFQGHRFYHSGRPSWTIKGMFFGTYERETVGLCRRLLKPGMVFVDVGAHIGCYAVIAAEAVGETGKVYAFEPCSHNANLLRRNVSLNGYAGRVEIVRKAVAHSTGEAALMVDLEDTGSSSMFGQRNASSDSVTVPTTTLDEFFAGKGWPQVDLIKTDIEGAEVAALQGMTELSRRNAGLKLIVEFSPKRISAAGASPNSFFAALTERGFSYFLLIDHRMALIRLPIDIPGLVRKAGYKGVNLLCLRAGY